MRVIKGWQRSRPVAQARVAIGVFDGVHRGHQSLLLAMVEAAHASGGPAVAITFDSHPAIALGGEAPLLLTSLEGRSDLLANLGIDQLIVLPFTAETARLGAEGFIDLLTQHVGLAELWGSAEFAIGRDREGNAAHLTEIGAERGFGVRLVEPLVWRGEPVSSSRVRRALREGDIDEATGCLGRPYRLEGAVVHGDGRGRLFGVPTANIAPPEGRMTPANGIYACTAHTEKLGHHPAVTNVGTRPSFPGRRHAVEAHLLDFDAEIYGQELSLDFHSWLRDEVAFSTTEELVGQIEIDIAQARAILSES